MLKKDGRNRMRMTRDEAIIAIQSKGFIRNKDGSYSKLDAKRDKNNSVATRIQMPKLESPVRSKSLGAPSNSKARPKGAYICVTGYYRKPLDDDNLCEKGLIDALRYAGFIRDDKWSDLRTTSQQYQVEKEEDEGTLIEIIVSMQDAKYRHRMT